MNVQKYTIQVQYQEYSDLEDCTEDDQRLLHAARMQGQLAYAPYSRFRVGAALLMDNGLIFTANNQENAAFPLGSCAERVVCGYAKAQYPDDSILAIAIHVNPLDYTLAQAVSPCGGCRQLILEYELKQKNPIRLILQANNSAVIVVEGVSTLLPLHFNGQFLQR